MRFSFYFLLLFFHFIDYPETFSLQEGNFFFPFPAKGKDCATNTDCIGITDTSCVKDFDYKLRCLCGDFRAPNNGFCSAKSKGLRHQCRKTEDCEDYMICRENNSTKTTILGSFSKDNSNKDRLCLCDEDSGYMENIIENHCNGKNLNFVITSSTVSS